MTEASLNSKPRRREKALSLTEIECSLQQTCGCERDCAAHLDLDTVLNWRTKYHQIPTAIARRQKLLDMYIESLFEERHANSLHLVCGKLVCRFTWYKIVMGISERTYTRVKRDVREGVRYVVAPRQERKGASKGLIALGFMEHYVSLYGDHHPENSRIILPMGITVTDIFKKFMQLHGDDCKISSSRFHSLWSQNMKHVSYQKHCKMSKCNVCCMARNLLEQNLAADVQAAVLLDREEHLQRQQQERQTYYKRRSDAIADPLNKTSIILDGMDQSKTNLPHFKGWSAPKELDPTNLLCTHLVGAEVHGTDTAIIMDFHQWPHDANLTANCLLLALSRKSTDKRLTKQIYIQLDNCGRENKNKYIIGIVAYLVSRGFVEEVYISFLMVGHTHEDIDARFSRISRALKHNHAYTVPQLEQVVQSAMATSNLVPIRLAAVFDIKEWLSPCLNEMHNHSFPHSYRIFKDGINHVALQYKNWTTDKDWLPEPSKEKLEIFKLDQHGNQLMPSDTLSLVEPDMTRKHNMDSIRANIAKCMKYMKSEDEAWWNLFLEDPNSLFASETQEWYLDGLLPCVEQETGVTPEGVDISSPLGLVMRKERSIGDVVTGPRKRRKPTDQSERPVCTDQTSVQEESQGAEAMRPLTSSGYMVAVIKNGHLIVGKVISSDNSKLVIQRVRGTLISPWNPVTDFHGNFVETEVSLSDIQEDMAFSLTKNKKLPVSIRDRLKKYFK